MQLLTSKKMMKIKKVVIAFFYRSFEERQSIVYY